MSWPICVKILWLEGIRSQKGGRMRIRGSFVLRMNVLDLLMYWQRWMQFIWSPLLGNVLIYLIGFQWLILRISQTFWNSLSLMNLVRKLIISFLRLNQQKLCLVIRQRLKYSAVSARIWINPRFYLGFFLCFLKKTFFIFSCIYFELSYLYSRYL